jgi:hypothetical protein
VSSFIEDGYVWYAPLKLQREATEIPVYNFEVENDNSYIVELCTTASRSVSRISKGFDDEGLSSLIFVK